MKSNLKAGKLVKIRVEIGVKRMGTMIVGKHIIAELYGVPKELIAKEEGVRQIVEEVIDEAGLTKVGSVYKQFNPHGVTGIVLISESHVSIHTWPEYELVNLDVFTCGDIDKAEKAFKLFLQKFKPKSYRDYVLSRG
ncbi:adenosylmethionine decarboxylase [Methermicoccus shengliensis]|nr:adenosylmethionine decarboxylase [Methermicoccus shengliensis]